MGDPSNERQGVKSILGLGAAVLATAVGISNFKLPRLSTPPVSIFYKGSSDSVFD